VRQLFYTLLRHAVDASEIATVRYRESKVVDMSSKLIDKKWWNRRNWVGGFGGHGHSFSKSEGTAVSSHTLSASNHSFQVQVVRLGVV
jgi:hypothetical protein